MNQDVSPVSNTHYKDCHMKSIPITQDPKYKFRLKRNSPERDNSVRNNALEELDKIVDSCSHLETKA